jgi:hypothetical protein
MFSTPAVPEKNRSKNRPFLKFLIPPMRAIFSAHLILLALINLIIFRRASDNYRKVFSAAAVVNTAKFLLVRSDYAFTQLPKQRNSVQPTFKARCTL